MILSALFAGTGPGVLAAALSGLAAWWFFVPPIHSFEVTGGTALALAFYAFIVGVDVAIIHFMQVALDRLVREQARTEALAEARGRDAAAVQASRERLRGVFDQASVGIGQLDREGRWVLVNDRLAALLGRSREELLGRGMEDLVHPEERAAHRAAREAVLSGGAPRQVEERHLRPRGRAIWVSHHLAPTRDPEGRVSGTISVVQDVEDRRAAEEGLRRANEALEAERGRLQDLFRRAPSFIAVLRGPEHVFELANDAFLRVVGRRDVAGRTVREALPELGPQGYFDRLDEVLATGRPFVGQGLAVRLREGEGAGLAERSLDFVLQPILEPDGTASGIFVEGYDVTARVRAQRGYEALNARLEAEVTERTRERDRAWALSRDLLAVLGEDGRLDGTNPAWEAALGLPAAPLRDRPFADLLHPEDRSGALAALAGGAGGTARFEARLSVSDGAERRIVWTAVAEDALVYLSGRDVTEERAAAAELERTQAALRQSQKMEAVGQLTGGVAHDFNNMLAIVIGSLSLAQRRLARGDAAVGRYLDHAMEGANRAADLTRRLLAFSRRQPLAPEALDANALVLGLAEMLRRTLGEAVTVETELAEGLWPLLADPAQLESALLNLSVNARDAMPGGGRLTISTANLRLGPAEAARLPEAQPGLYVAITVSDTGTGMPTEVVARAFDPFFTTKEVGKGTGLGLSQVHGFVRQSGGTVTIESEPGRGTAVRLLLSRAASAAARPRPRAAEGGAEGPPRARAGEVVLVVEDEERVRRFTVEALHELGYEVIHAEGAGTALERLDVHPGIALLFTDVVMPGANGVRLAEEARRRRPGLRVLFATGYAGEAPVQGEGHGTRLLHKPFTLEQLARKVRTVLDEAAEGEG